MYGSLDISTSGMIAQRTRMAAISANIANANTRLGADAGYAPYARRDVHFAESPDGGVVVADITKNTNFELRHGEAVAIGIALDCVYAHLLGKLSEAALSLILQTFETLGFELYVPALSSHLDDPTHPDSLFRGLAEFREHLGGELTVLLLDAIGKGNEVHEVDYAVYREAISMLQEYEGEMLS